MVDPESPTWLHIKGEITKLIEEDRNFLEMSGSIETAQLARGRIQMARKILALAKPAPTIRSDVGTIL